MSERYGSIILNCTPKTRTKQTLSLIASRLNLDYRLYYPCEQDVFNEGNIEDYYDGVRSELESKYSRKEVVEVLLNRWAKAWLDGDERPFEDFKTAKEVVAEICFYFLEEIELIQKYGYKAINWHLVRHGRKNNDGYLSEEGIREIGMYCDIEYEGIPVCLPQSKEIDNLNVTHGPVLMALLYYFGKKIDKEIIKQPSGKMFNKKIKKLKHSNFFVYTDGEFDFLNYVNISYKVNNPNILTVFYFNQSREVPLYCLKELMMDYMDIEEAKIKYANEPENPIFFM